MNGASNRTYAVCLVGDSYLRGILGDIEHALVVGGVSEDMVATLCKPVRGGLYFKTLLYRAEVFGLRHEVIEILSRRFDVRVV